MTMIIRMIWFFNVLPPSKQLVSHIGIFPEFFVCLFDLILYVPSIFPEFFVCLFDLILYVPSTIFQL